MKIKVIFTIFIWLFCSGIAAAEANFPFRGTITKDSVHIRAGYNQNFESLAQLNQGDILTVVDKKYSWYKVLLPKKAECFVHKDWVKKQEESGKGIITGNHVNIRARPGLKSGIIGQLNKDDVIEIIEKKGDWVRFVPIKGCFGWIKEEHLKFLDNNLLEEANSQSKEPEIR